MLLGSMLQSGSGKRILKFQTNPVIEARVVSSVQYAELTTSKGFIGGWWG
jgi:hypothetical protein